VRQVLIYKAFPESSELSTAPSVQDFGSLSAGNSLPGRFLGRTSCDFGPSSHTRNSAAQSHLEPSQSWRRSQFDVGLLDPREARLDVLVRRDAFAYNSHPLLAILVLVVSQQLPFHALFVVDFHEVEVLGDDAHRTRGLDFADEIRIRTEWEAIDRVQPNEGRVFHPLLALRSASLGRYEGHGADCTLSETKDLHHVLVAYLDELSVEERNNAGISCGRVRERCGRGGCGSVSGSVGWTPGEGSSARESRDELW